MFINPHNLRGSSTHTGNSASRWRTVFIALMLALTFGGTSQTAPAQAAPAGELTFVSMKVGNPKAKFCPGETVTYVVQVEFRQIYQVDNPPSQPGNGLPVPKITVDATSQNGSVGDFVDVVKEGLVTRRTSVLPADDDLMGLGASFKFKANKVGKTTLYFQGLVQGQYVSVNLPVEVVHCKYKVKVVWKHKDVIYHTTGSSNLVLMTRDESGLEPGSTFTGKGSMRWVYAYVDKTCKQRATASNGQVDLSGSLDDDSGQFTVTETFGASTIPSSVSCPGGGGGAVGKGTLDPLTFKVGSSGGTFPQALAGGTATITVIAVDK